MESLDWLDLVREPLDAFGFALFLLVFPIYHGIYPWLMDLFPDRAAKTRIDLYRRSWIERLVREEDILLAAQQTRNLTMVNTLLASSALILMGFTANVLIETQSSSLELALASSHVKGQPVKLLLLIVVFGAAFAYCMTSLRYLGHFNMVIGADTDVIELHETSAVDYLAGLINRSSNRYTLAVRSLYSASPLFFWLFDSRLFVGVTLLWALKFIGFQDFVFGVLRRERAARPGAGGDASAAPTEDDQAALGGAATSGGAGARPRLDEAAAADATRRRRLID